VLTIPVAGCLSLAWPAVQFSWCRSLGRGPIRFGHGPPGFRSSSLAQAKLPDSATAAAFTKTQDNQSRPPALLAHTTTGSNYSVYLTRSPEWVLATTRCHWPMSLPVVRRKVTFRQRKPGSSLAPLPGLGAGPKPGKPPLTARSGKELPSRASAQQLDFAARRS